jgi:hypothetical protein
MPRLEPSHRCLLANLGVSLAPFDTLRENVGASRRYALIMPILSCVTNNFGILATVGEVMATITRSTEDDYSPEETERRARDAIRRSFKIPHKPQKEMVGRTGHGKRPPSKTTKKAK